MVMKRPAAVILCLFLAGGTLFGEVVEKTRSVSRMTLHYKVILPVPYDPAKEYPAVLSFAGGSQTMEGVDNDIERGLRKQAETRGYIVILPAAPGGRLFFEGGEEVFPEFFKILLADYKIRGGKFHAAGHSNGGISAFQVAARWPQYFWSVTGYPGYLMEASPSHLNAISKMCVNMHVGERDTGWRKEMQDQAQVFRSRGIKVRTTVEPNEPHLIAAFAGAGAARLFDQFDECGK